jgi:hypothetical protein
MTKIDTVDELNGYYVESFNPIFNPENSYAYLGCLFGGGVDDRHYGVIQFDNSGNVQNYHRIISYGTKEIYLNLSDFAISTLQEIYLSLNISNQYPNVDSVDFFPTLVKINSDGSNVWTYVFSVPAGDNLTSSVNSIDLDQGGNIWATGQIEAKPYLAKISGSGQQTWMRANENEYGTGKIVACDGSDGAFSYLKSNGDIWISKYDDLGNITAEYSIEGISIGIPASVDDMKFDSNHFLFTTGTEYGTTWDIHTRKIYDQSLGVNDETQVNNFHLFQNYPNPFNPTTTINYQIPKAGFVSLKVFDILGKEVAELVNKEKVAGRYEVQFDASKLSSGIYFYQLITKSFTQTRKMLLLK